MASAWYVLQVYSGYEKRLEKKLRGMIDSGELDKSVVQDVKIPTEETTEIRDGKKRTQTKLSLPGYLLIELDLPDNRWKETCYALRAIDGISGFVGTPPTRKPHPLHAEEARSLLARAGEIKGERVSRAHTAFSTGERVKITDGPFESFTGVIDEVNNDKTKLKVMVGIFGRNTPVEVDFNQVEKV
jgi:transcriptional antiterminator NusG